MSDEKKRMYEIRTVSVATQICRMPDTERLRLYEAIRCSVYGMPGRAIPMLDLVHCLAEMLNFKDPSGDQE